MTVAHHAGEQLLVAAAAGAAGRAGARRRAANPDGGRPPAGAEAQVLTKEDESTIVAAALDYFEGWFDGDVARMERALHPELAKRALMEDRSTLDETTAEWMLDATAKHLGNARDVRDRRIEVDIVDVHGDVASAVVRSAVYREYLHLVRTREGWRIVNALWAWS